MNTVHLTFLNICHTPMDRRLGDQEVEVWTCTLFRESRHEKGIHRDEMSRTGCFAWVQLLIHMIERGFSKILKVENLYGESNDESKFREALLLFIVNNF